MMQAGITFVMHYLDDHLFFLPPSSVSSTSLLSQILGIFDYLEVPVADDKVDGPITVVTFLGIQIDTVRFELTLPPHELECIRELVRSWRGRRSGRHNDLDSLLGHLSHAATIIQHGRVFLCHLYDIQARTGSGCLTTMFTLKPRHERTFCGGSISYRPGVALWSSGTPLFLQFMFTLMPHGCSLLAVCGHHTFDFSCNGPQPGPQLTSSSRVWSHWLSWQHSGAGIGTNHTFASTLTMKQ